MKPEETKNKVRTAKQADKIIAEFMGTKYNHICIDYADKDKYLSDLYSESLDALVPVWEKLGDRFSMNYYRESELHCDTNGVIHRFTFCDDMLSDTKEVVENYNVHQAAAIATAKAILVLEDK